MNKKKYPTIEETGNKHPFRVPEGYFEGLPQQIMDRLDEVTVETPPAINWWVRVKPWVYMAAMFAGIALMFKLFKGDFERKDQLANGKETVIGQQTYFEDENIEDVYDYLEYEAIRQNYRETVYINEN